MVGLVLRPFKTIQHQFGFANKFNEKSALWVGGEFCPDAFSAYNVNR